MEFAFGFCYFYGGHAFFDFTGKEINLKSERLQEDNILKSIFSEGNNFTYPFERFFSACMKKNYENPKLSEPIGISIGDFFEKIGFPNKEDLIARFIIKNPEFLREISSNVLDNISLFSTIMDDFRMEENSIIFPRLTKEITDPKRLFQTISPILEMLDFNFSHPFYHSSTGNEGLFKAYTDILHSSGRIPRIVQNFVLTDLNTNYRSFARVSLVNLILEICSNAAIDYFERKYSLKKQIYDAINQKNDRKRIEDLKERFTDAIKNDRTIEILSILSFLTKEYLKGYSFSFTTRLDQPSDYKRIVSPSFYARFALEYDLPFEFIREIGNESFDHRFIRYFRGLEIEQEKFDQLKNDFGEYEFFKQMETAIQNIEESDDSIYEDAEETLSEEKDENLNQKPGESWIWNLLKKFKSLIFQ